MTRFSRAGRDARSSPGRLGRDPVSSRPAIEASPRTIAPRSRRSGSVGLRESRVERRVETQSRHRFAHARSLADACAFSRHLSSRRFAAPRRASPRPPFASDQSPPRDPLHVFPASQNAGKTAAMIAASNGSTEILKAIGRGPSLLDLKDADGGTAAMTAAVHKHGSVLDFVRLPRAQTDRFRSRHRARLLTRPRARDRTRRGDKRPDRARFPDPVPGNPRQRQNRRDLFLPGSQTVARAGSRDRAAGRAIRHAKKRFRRKDVRVSGRVRRLPRV